MVLALAAAAAASHRHKLAGASHVLAHVSGPQLAAAVALEAASLVFLAALQRWLLRSAGGRLGLGTMTGIVVAANAMAGILPGGSALSVAWTVRQLRRRDIALALATAVLITAGVLSVLALALLVALGALAADPAGPAPGLRMTLLASAAVLAATVVLAVCLIRSARFHRAARHAWTYVTARWRAGRRLADFLAEVFHQARAIQPGVRGWARPFGLALGNWTCDAAALAAVLWALNIAVPWRSILIVYGLTQIAVSLRLTPGSLGIAEASLSTLLVVYGLRADQAIAAALLYRIVSFWALQPIGWASWLRLTLRRTPAQPGTGRARRQPGTPRRPTARPAPHPHQPHHPHPHTSPKDTS
ncbi:flippase-like domain-containing protein [Streptomyces canus]|uniref:lysylphosphatidylglycerol synthase transmembrane domain-containing protein n=1 Tax=Streptomyces canus TaxID=58343 RepID=UPI0036ED7D8F